MNNFFIRRDSYIEKIRPFIGHNLIKILTGQRRIGKSYILLQLVDIIKNEFENANIININKELAEFKDIKTNQDLYEKIKTESSKTLKNFVFIDEIQEIQDFQNCLRSLLVEGNFDIYCTGSNASLLSGEIATLLAGRYIEIPIHSLSYNEFLTFHSLPNENQSLQKYLSIGGMPYLYHFEGNDANCFEYLKNLYSTILLRDVVTRKQIRDVDFMERLVEYLGDNIGNLFSSANISKYLKSQNQQLPVQKVIDYIAGLEQAFFIHRAKRYDLKGLRVFEVGEKYFFEDIGLRNAITGVNPIADIHKLMKNVVYLHLIRQGYEVFVGKMDDYEIDFVGKKLQKKIYVQVAFRLEQTKTITREQQSLLKIEDVFPKYIVTLDEFLLGTTSEGINIIHLRDFLSNETV